jgi:hypothetical protein
MLAGETSRLHPLRLLRLTLVITCIALVPAEEVTAQDRPPFVVNPGNLQKRVNGVLTLLAFSVTPDATASSLSIDSASTGNPGLTMGQLGAGFTMSTSFRLYLEGFGGYSRYDPTFVASNGEEERRVPLKWNTLSGTGGIGWDFPLFWDIKLRPIFNFSLGHVESDLSLLERGLNFVFDRNFDFIDGGRLNAYGLGGAVMLDLERYREAYELDVELRYTNILLQSFDTSAAVQGHVDAQAVSLWARWRQPTGIVALRRPLRYVLEFANTTYVGDQAGALGFNYLSQVGAGIELDTSAYHSVLTRVRFVGRYVFGENVSGVSGGIAVTFF